MFMLSLLIPTAHAQEIGSSTLVNPFSSASSIPELLGALLNVLLIISVPFIVIFIIYAGFTYVTARGNPEKVKAANRSLLYALLGSVIVFGAYALFAILQSVVDAFSA
jgi:hypothetical protein